MKVHERRPRLVRFGRKISPSRTSHRIDPAIAQAARRSDIADPQTYDMPNTHRESVGNLSLSIVVLVIAAVIACALVVALR